MKMTQLVMPSDEFFSILLTIPICELITVVNGSTKNSIILNQGSEYGETDNCSAQVL
jgi:hypothetical protein